MTPHDWTALLDPANRNKTIIAKEVTTQARRYLTKLPQGKLITTKELAEGLFPLANVRGPQMEYARRRLIRFLVGEPGHILLPECRLRDTTQTRNYAGRRFHPWLWRCPPEGAHYCPHCGGLLLPADQSSSPSASTS